VVGKSLAGPVKIGKSVNPMKRILDLEFSNGARFEHAWISPHCTNYAEIEASLHEVLRRMRLVGEWFNHPFPVAVDLLRAQSYAIPDARERLRSAAERGGKPPPKDIEEAMRAYERSNQS
jgi:hypothetical protein